MSARNQGVYFWGPFSTLTRIPEVLGIWSLKINF